MNPEDNIRQSKRTLLQKFFTDPLVALLALFVWEILKHLKAKRASAIGAILGSFVGTLMKRRNHIGLINLKIAFPQKTEQERKKILKEMWRHWGRFYAEMPHASELFKEATFIGMENLREAAKKGKGGFVCSAHLGNWELAVSQPLFDDFYLNPVYRRANNPWLDKLMFQRRTGVLIPKGIAGARKIMEVLHQKGFVVMLCDQKLREGIPVPLFGREAMTAPAIAVLALKFQVPIIMARSIRQQDGHYEMEISKPLVFPEEVNTDKAVQKIMTDINAIFEQWIHENPEQWLWIHRRFHKSLYR